MSQADNLAALATNVNSSGVLQPASGGTGVTSATGTGSVVLSNSPTLVTPTLGSASATQLTTGLGSAAAPALTFTGDTNTGIFSPTADTIAFSEGGTESMRIDSSGNVGIGTSSPAGRLSVNGAYGTTATAGLNIVSTGSTTGLLSPMAFYLQSSGWGTQHQATITAQQVSGTDSGANLLFSTSTTGQFAPTERMRIDSSGNLLVGTTTSAGNLTVRSGGTNSGSLSLSAASGGGGASYLIMGNGDSGGASGPNVIVSANRNLQFGFGTSFSSTSGGTFTEAMRIDSSSNLLFNSGYGSVATAYGCRAWVSFDGTTSPGTIRASGNVSSVTKNGSGDYTVNFTNNFPDANYTAAGNATYATANSYHGLFLGGINGVSGSTRSTSACQFTTRYMNGSNPPPLQDCAYVCVAFFR